MKMDLFFTGGKGRLGVESGSFAQQWTWAPVHARKRSGNTTETQYLF
jgi:hypothetical protein